MTRSKVILYEERPEDLSEAVFIALGYASTCWENMSGTGVFQSSDAKAAGDQLLEYIQEHYVIREEWEPRDDQ